MKIYTGSGDRGKTSLFSGERVSKDDLRVEACGDVDELNSLLGMLAAMLTLDDGPSEIIEELEWIQSSLFQIGALLATTRESPALDVIAAISEENVTLLESSIDRMTEELPALKAFILPGGHVSAGLAHTARTVCRRAERRVVSLSDAVKAGKAPQVMREAIVYLNRLSDYLFTLARYCNWSRGLSEKVWTK